MYKLRNIIYYYWQIVTKTYGDVISIYSEIYISSFFDFYTYVRTHVQK
jgi:hypothetical protein